MSDYELTVEEKDLIVSILLKVSDDELDYLVQLVYDMRKDKK